MNPRRAFTLAKPLVVIVVIGILVVAGIIVWRGFSPAAKDSDFKLNYMHFQMVPNNLLVVRPTHFTNDTGSFVASTSPKPGQNVMRMLGRKVPLEEVMAAAYGCNPARIVPPLIKPMGDFDYLVTVPNQPRERFQAAVKKKLGYTAHWEDRDTDVLLLETIAPDPPAFKLSADPNSKSYFQSGKYWFFHMQPASLLGYLESSFKQPILDRTEMTNFYDFSVAISWRKNDEPTLDDLKNTLGKLGLKLEPAAESVPMLVVEKTR